MMNLRKELPLRMLILLFLIIKCNSQTVTLPNNNMCSIAPNGSRVVFMCPDNHNSVDLTIDYFANGWDHFRNLKVTGKNGRGPLTSIPNHLFYFNNLTELDLSNNQLNTADFSFLYSYLSQLQILRLNDNYLTELPVQWIPLMPNLKEIYLGKNQLTSLSYKTFLNIKNIQILDVSFNNLTSFELWLSLINGTINYSSNPVTHLTNNENVDLSKDKSYPIGRVYFENITTKINLNDGIFEMYNRCEEIKSTNGSIIVKKIINEIHRNYQYLLNWSCECEQYYLQEYIISMLLIPNFTIWTWKCSDQSNQTYGKVCKDKSTFKRESVTPRLCEIPRFVGSNTSIEILLWDILRELNETVLIDEFTVHRFANIIDEANTTINSTSVSDITSSIQETTQKIINRIEKLLESITIPLNSNMNTVSILSRNKTEYSSYSQIKHNDSSLSYSTGMISYDSIATTTTITFDPSALERLNETDVYTIYYLPISFFRIAQIDPNTIIIPPIVGLHLLQNISYLINISFTDIQRSSGNYSCVFWDYNQWNSSGCTHSFNSTSNRHLCSCNHTTSFALIFIPDKIISTTYIPSIIISFVSIVCFCISIIVSIYRQATYFRHLSILNIFTLLNSILLFVLFTVIFIQGYRSNRKSQDSCSKSQENLVLTTYFFLITTFASKTLLGFCYFLTIFFHFIFIQLTSISNRWFYSGIALVFLLALIPTIILQQLLKQWKNLFRQYQGICWLNSNFVFKFISIPILIFICSNLILIGGITIRLLKFVFARKTMKIIEKRLIHSMMIWLSLCITLGIAWIFGPFLDIFIVNKDQTSSIIQLWIFAIFIGLEGLWVLIVNIVFCVNQKLNSDKRRHFLNKK